MRRLIWSSEAREDYLWWERQDKETLKRINRLILDVQRFGPGDGVGKPERLRGADSGLWSRRIDEANRFVHRIIGDDVEIVACKTRYDDH